jgi:hypothetical protein
VQVALYRRQILRRQQVGAQQVDFSSNLPRQIAQVDARLLRDCPCLIAYGITGALRQVGGSRPDGSGATPSCREVFNEYGRVYDRRARHAICSRAGAPLGDRPHVPSTFRSAIAQKSIEARRRP